MIKRWKLLRLSRLHRRYNIMISKFSNQTNNLYWFDIFMFIWILEINIYYNNRFIQSIKKNCVCMLTDSPSSSLVKFWHMNSNEIAFRNYIYSEILDLWLNVWRCISLSRSGFTESACLQVSVSQMYYL